jgi:hypothetical protein
VAKKRVARVVSQSQPVKAAPVRVWNAAGFTPLLLATLIAYWPALIGAFLRDENGHVTKPELQSMHGLWRIWFDLGATQQ